MLYLELEITKVPAVAVIIDSFLNKMHSQYDVDNNDADLLTENVCPSVPVHAILLFQWFLISFVVQTDILLWYLCHILLL